MKVVLDTNVLLAAFGTRGLCEALMAIVLERHELFFSEPILDETAEHLAGKFKVPAVRVKETIAFLRQHGRMIEPADLPQDACRDPDDVAILGTAVAARADCLVTGDQDLLSLRRYEGIAILAPRAFYELVK